MQLNWHAGVKKVENYVTCLDIVPLFLFLSILFAVLGEKFIISTFSAKCNESHELLKLWYKNECNCN